MRRGSGFVIAWFLTAVITLVFGVIGFSVEGFPFGEALYKTLQMFFVNSNPEDFWNGMTWVAAFSGAFSSFVGLVGILLNAFWDQVSLAWIRTFWKKHVIIVGLGERALVLSRKLAEFESPGPNILALDPKVGHEYADEIRSLRGAHIVASGTDSDIWDLVQVKKARSVFILTGDDQTNADIEACVRSKTGGKVPIYTCFNDPLLAITLGESQAHHPDVDKFSLALLRHEGTDASGLWAQVPPDAPTSSGREVGDSVNVPLKAYEGFWTDRGEGAAIVFGSGPMLEACIIEWANARAIRGRKGATLLALGPDARDVVDRLKTWHGGCAVAKDDLIGEDTCEGVALINRITTKVGLAAPSFVAHVTSADDSWNLRNAVAIANIHLDPGFAEVSCAIIKSAGLSSLVGRAKEGGYVRGVTSINIYDLAANHLRSPRTELDRLVEACYSAYVVSQGDTPKTLHNIPDKEKAPTLAQATFLVHALRQKGLGLSRIHVGRDILTEDVVAYLAERDHERWRLYCLRDGFKYGPKRDVEKKERATLLPWSSKWDIPNLGKYQEQSSDAEFLTNQAEMKDHDTGHIRKMFEILREQGVCLVRLNKSSEGLSTEAAKSFNPGRPLGPGSTD